MLTHRGDTYHLSIGSMTHEPLSVKRSDVIPKDFRCKGWVTTSCMLAGCFRRVCGGFADRFRLALYLPLTNAVGPSTGSGGEGKGHAPKESKFWISPDERLAFWKLSAHVLPSSYTEAHHLKVTRQLSAVRWKSLASRSAPRRVAPAWGNTRVLLNEILKFAANLRAIYKS